MDPLVLGGDLLPGLAIAIYGVAFWTGGVLVAAYLWRRWRGEGPSSRVDDARSTGTGNDAEE